MRHFTVRDVKEAQDYAAAGGQALHTHQIIVDYDKAPACFVRAVEKGEDIAHLFDQDSRRLVRTAIALGIRDILVERRGQRGQHIDLCGKPLSRALKTCIVTANATMPLFGQEAFQCPKKCCGRAGEYNGFGSDGPLAFRCPGSCSCHD